MKELSLVVILKRFHFSTLFYYKVALHESFSKLLSKIFFNVLSIYGANFFFLGIKNPVYLW